MTGSFFIEKLLSKGKDMKVERNEATSAETRKFPPPFHAMFQAYSGRNPNYPRQNMKICGGGPRRDGRNPP